MFELIKKQENCTHIKIYRLEKDGIHCMGGLGIFIEVDSVELFEIQYDNAGIKLSNINATFEEIQNSLKPDDKLTVE